MAAEGETGRTDCVLGFFLSSFIRRKPMGCLVHIYIYIYIYIYTYIHIHRKQMGAVLLFFFFSSSFFFFEALLGTLDLRNEKVISLSLSF